MSAPLDLSAGRRLTEAELERVSPVLARVASGVLVDAYDGPGGTFIVYARASQVFVCTLDADGPAMIEVRDLHGWPVEFAVPAACALAAGAIVAKESNGLLEISETDSDRAYDSHRAPPPTGLLQRTFRSVPWGVAPEGLDPALRLLGLWDDAKTTLTLILGAELAPFKRLYHRFKDGKLTTVDVGSVTQGDWSVVESFEAGLRRHLPDAKVFEDDGTPWSAAASRSRLEGRERAELNLNFDLAGTRLLGRLIASHEKGQQIYHLLIMAKPP